MNDDEQITDNKIIPNKGGGTPFFRGWNFVTDLYRILEHTVESLRARCLFSEGDPSKAVGVLFSHRSGPHPSDVLKLVENLYTELPNKFKEVKDMSGVLKEDRFGFQGKSRDHYECIANI